MNIPFLGSKERDTETGLDYFGARYLASVQGRFTSPDPLYLELNRLGDPQQFNLYSYARNSPLKFIDPTGLDIEVTGTEQDAYLKRLQQNLSFKVQRNTTSNKVQIIDANGSVLDQTALKALGKTLKSGEKELFNAITDTKNHVTIDTVRRDANVDFGRFDGKGKNTIDAADLDLLDAPKNAGGLSSAQVVGHETLEAYAAAKSGATDPANPHSYANRYFGGLGAIDQSTVRFGGYPGPVNQILRVSFEMPIHNGGGARTRVTREFLTPIPENAIPRGHVPAHIIDVEKKP
jgi:RHS repeat-associated protein